MVNRIIHEMYTEPSKALQGLASSIIKSGSKFLSSSRDNPQYGISDREMFGLWVIFELRNFLEPEKHWFINTEKEISDDGIVGHFTIEESVRVNYIEFVEQLYLPGKYLDRRPEELVSPFLIRSTLEKKARGSQYERGMSLLVLNDTNSGDPFYWAEYAKELFTKTEFLHLYFLALEKPGKTSNDYYLVSFTNQVHRQYLNGEFRFRLKKSGIDKFRRTDDLTEALKGLPKLSPP